MGSLYWAVFGRSGKSLAEWNADTHIEEMQYDGGFMRMLDYEEHDGVAPPQPFESEAQARVEWLF